MNSKASPSSPAASVEHIRRCHKCGAINCMSNSAITHCAKCGKALAPFYYFDESGLTGISETDLHLSLVKFARTIQPIWGLSTYWEPE